MNILTNLLLLYSTCFLFQSVTARPKDPEFCNRGFQISGKYHECWEQATYANAYPELYERHDMYTGKFVEEYAIHMCSVVKPKALDCLRKAVERCSNSKKLVEIADESGGACTGNHLNPFFKLHILDHLVPIPGNSTCFEIADMSYECYVSAGDVIMKSGESTVDISHFHKVADKFFNHIWDCLINVFKSNTDKCEHWQIPMLLALQKTAMPSLFGMRLNNYQVQKLELTTEVIPPTTSNGTEGNCSKVNDNKVYVLLKVLSSKPQAEEGDVVLEVNAPVGSKPEISFAGGNPDGDDDVKTFVDKLVDQEKQLSLKEIRQLRREQRKKNKEITSYLNRIRNSQIRRQKQGAQKRPGMTNKNNGGSKKKPVNRGDEMINDGVMK